MIHHITIDIKKNHLTVHKKRSEPWRITLVDTGENTMTGGRLKRVYDYVKDEEAFCFTYGDGVSNININESIQFHKKHGLLATVTAGYPPGRFGVMNIAKNKIVKSFIEKPKESNGIVNEGFFILSPEVIKLIKDDQTIWEMEPLENLANGGQMKAYLHSGFWQPIDTLRDKNYLEELWLKGAAPWKIWN